MVPGLLSAQQGADQPKWELQGTGSYQSTERSGPGPYFHAEGWSRSRVLTLTPMCGYFVTDNIELIADLRFVRDIYENDFENLQPYRDVRDQIGFSIGAGYNYRLTSFFMPYIAVKAGLAWTRLTQDIGDDSRWGSRQVILPDVVLGGRLLFSSQWAGVISIEYRRIRPVMDYYYGQWDEYEMITVAVGFSVFI
jgi:hypothetical protein